MCGRVDIQSKLTPFRLKSQQHRACGMAKMEGTSEREQKQMRRGFGWIVKVILVGYDS